MEYVDYSELKLPVGRPPEEQVEERKDLTRYILERKFEKRWSAFFQAWERFIMNRAKRAGKPKYIDYMEEFYGEVLAKFEELPEGKKDEVVTTQYPIRKLYEYTNLSEPNLFHEPADNEEFLEVLKNEEL